MKPEVEQEQQAKAQEKENAGENIAKEAPPPRPLHDCACYLLSLAHSWLERMTQLPFPIGTIIRCIEDTVDPWTHPLTHSLEHHSLFILAAIDDKLLSLVDSCGLCTKAQLRVVLSQICAQGLVGTTAVLWIKYEGVVKEDIRKAVCLTNRVPFVNIVAPIVFSVLGPSAASISDWLLKQGESYVKKGLQTIKQEREDEGQNASSSIQAGPVTKLDVSDVQYEGQNVSSVHENDSSTEQRSVWSNADAVKNGVLGTQEQMVVTQEGISGDDDIFDEVKVDKVVMEKSGQASLAKEGDDPLPDVPEMIESSWLLGTSAFPRKLHRPSQTKHVSSFGFQIKRTFFKG